MAHIGTNSQGPLLGLVDEAGELHVLAAAVVAVAAACCWWRFCSPACCRASPCCVVCFCGLPTSVNVDFGVANCSFHVCFAALFFDCGGVDCCTRGVCFS